MYIKTYKTTMQRRKKVFIVFDNMVVDMELIKKTKTYSHSIVLERHKIQHFTCFSVPILFQKA